MKIFYFTVVIRYSGSHHQICCTKLELSVHTYAHKQHLHSSQLLSSSTNHISSWAGSRPARGNSGDWRVHKRNQDQSNLATVQRVWGIGRITIVCRRALFPFPPHCDIESRSSNRMVKWAEPQLASLNHWSWARPTSTRPAHWPVCRLPTYTCMFHKNALWCGK